MPVTPPFSLIPQLAQLRAQPSMLSAISKQLGDTLVGIGQISQKKHEDEMKNVSAVMSNYDIRPTPDGQAPTNSASAKDIISAMNGGKVPKWIPQSLLGMQAVPKMDVQALAHILPAILNNQPPGKSTPVVDQGDGKGGVVQPGTVPGLSADATVTPKPAGKGGSGGGGGNPATQWNQASTSARARVKQLTDVALADPASANVKNFPILSAKENHKQFLKAFQEEAELRGLPKDEISAKVEEEKAKMNKADKEFQSDLDDGLTVLNKYKKDPKQLASVKQTVRKRLLEKHGVDYQYEIASHPELK